MVLSSRAEMRETDMRLSTMKSQIKKRLFILATRHKGGTRIIMMLRSGREAAVRNFLGDDIKSQATNEIDPHALAAALKQAQIAHHKGQKRLAVLLAHQCDCISDQSSNPELAALLADLRTETTIH